MSKSFPFPRKVCLVCVDVLPKGDSDGISELNCFPSLLLPKTLTNITHTHTTKETRGENVIFSNEPQNLVLISVVIMCF